MSLWLHAVLSLSLLASASSTGGDDDVMRIGQLAGRGQWVEAAELAEAVLAAGNAHPDIGFTAGNMRLKAGHHAHAWRHYARYLDAPEDDQGRISAEKRLAELASSTRVVEVRVAPAVAGTRLVARRLDPHPPPDLESPVVDGVATVRLDLGAWDLRVEAPGYPPVVHALGRDAAPGPIAVTLQSPTPATPPRPPPPAPSPPPPPPPPRLSGARVAGAVLLPLGLVALGGAIAVIPGYQRSGAARNHWEDVLTADPCDAQARAGLGDVRATARRQESLLIGLGVAAAALVTTGAVLLVRARHEPRRRAHLGVAPGAVVLGLSGRF